MTKKQTSITLRGALLCAALLLVAAALVPRPVQAQGQSNGNGPRQSGNGGGGGRQGGHDSGQGSGGHQIHFHVGNVTKRPDHPRGNGR